MKVLLFLSLIIISCAHKETPVETPISQEKPQIVEMNLDRDMYTSLKKIWNQNFQNDYNDTKAIDLFVVTNRKSISSQFGCTNQNFAVDPDTNLGTVGYRIGICRINVPKNHSTGEIKSSLDPNANSHEFFKIIGSKQIYEATLFTQIKKTNRIPLIFVHGFNVRYQDAVLKATQIAYDLKYQGPVVLFTWPSGSKEGFLDEKLLNKTYEMNQQSARETVDIFKKFLERMQAANMEINIMIHSMGHQVVLPAIAEFGRTTANPDKKLIHELILNAPDYDVKEFREQIEIIKKSTDRITLYCSNNDKAMTASTAFNKTVRLGACSYLEDVDSVNVTMIDNSTFGLGHSYYSSRSILTDVFQVLLGIDADKRLFIRKSEPNAQEKFWLRN